MDLSKIYAFWNLSLVLLLHIISAHEKRNDGISKDARRNVKERKRLVFTSHADRKAFASENVDKFESHKHLLRRLIRTVISRKSCDEEKTEDVVRLLREGRSNSLTVQREMEKLRQRLGNQTVMCKIKHKRRRRLAGRSRTMESEPKELSPDNPDSWHKEKSARKDRFVCPEDTAGFNITQLKSIETEMKKDNCWNTTDFHIVSRLSSFLVSERTKYRSRRMQMVRLKCKLLNRYHSCQKKEAERIARPKPRNTIQEEFWSNFGYPDLNGDDELGELGLLFY